MDEKMPPGLAPRVAVSIVVFFGWLIFLVMFLAFYAGNFNIYQNLAIIIVSILVGIAILAPMWAYWGIKYGRRFDKEWKPTPRKKSLLEKVVFPCWLLFIALFLWFYAGNFNTYQNLAIVLVSILVAVAVVAPIKYREMRCKQLRPRRIKRSSRSRRRRKK